MLLMNISDTVTKDIVFQAESDKRGVLTCRHCEKQVVIKIKVLKLIFFATSRIKVYGKWCGCSDLGVMLRGLVSESS
jgi:hypothetical protein